MATSRSQHAPSNVSVMISYSRSNKDFVDRLQSDLIECGFPTWVDRSNIPGGADWKQEISNTIANIQVVLVVLSPEAVASKLVKWEYTRALNLHKIVIPISYYPCDIPSGLAQLHALDFQPRFPTNPEAQYTKQLAQLIELLAGYETLEIAPTSAQANRFRFPWRPGKAVKLYLKDRERFLSKLQMRYTNRLVSAYEGAIPLTLGLSEDTQAVARPHLASLSAPNEQLRPLPSGTTITEAFLAAEGQMLILGAPGAGKSTLLYQLGLDMVTRARADGTISMPVAFALASWAQTRKPLEEWMADELIETWQVPPNIAHAWVKQREIMPLIDGLDEVRENERDACIAAINVYQRAHGLDAVAVCCRTQEYAALSQRLDLRRAVVAQPLTPEQIDLYLATGKERLAALRELAHTNAEIRELASTPLLLSILSLAYQNTPVETIPRPTEDRQAWLQTVFHDYVQRMYKHRAPELRGKRSASYSIEATTYYLAWLANAMRSHGQSDMFYFERLQPDWLSDGKAQNEWRRNAFRVVGVMNGLVSGFISGMIWGIIFSMSQALIGIFQIITEPGFVMSPLLLLISGMLSGLSLGAGLGVVGALIGAAVGVLQGRFINTHRLTASKDGGARTRGAALVDGLVFALNYALAIGLLITLFITLANVALPTGTAESVDSLLAEILGQPPFEVSGYSDLSVIAVLYILSKFVLVGGLILGLINGITFWRMGGFTSAEGAIKLTGGVRLRRPKWSAVLGGLTSGLLGGFILTEIFSGEFTLLALAIGLTAGVLGSLVGTVSGAIQTREVDPRDLDTPDTGFKRAQRSTIVFGAIAGLLGIFISYLLLILLVITAGNPGLTSDQMLTLLIAGASIGAPIGIGIGLMSGVVYGISFGLPELIRHRTLLRSLIRLRLMPPHPIEFYDFAAEHVLLQRVGGGYRFIHALLLDYFADQWPALAQQSPQREK